MKNLTLLLIVCGLIFAASPLAFALEDNNTYTSIDWKRYLPRPIYPVPDSLLISDTVEVKSSFASIDWKKYLPRPIYPVPDSLLIPDSVFIKSSPVRSSYSSI
jgi:hypothetical protein